MSNKNKVFVKPTRHFSGGGKHFSAGVVPDKPINKDWAEKLQADGFLVILPAKEQRELLKKTKRSTGPTEDK